jgi:spore coat polysaccharide biosynthesis predicted glycosyltransferase SpsG
MISDLKKINYDANLVINGFIGFKNMKTTNRYGTTCFIGPKYQILNKNYERKIQHTRKKYFFLVTLGGFDEKKIIDVVCNQLIKHLDKIKVKIILGPVTKKSNLIKNLESKNYKNFKVVYKVDSLIKEISKTQFGICAGGITSYEFASLGVPTVIICQYKHQLQTAKEWEKNGVGLNLGMPNSSFEQKLQKTIQKILDGKIMIKSKRSLVDGKGASRVSKEIFKI